MFFRGADFIDYKFLESYGMPMHALEDDDQHETTV